MKNYSLFATTPKAMEFLLAEELEQLGAQNIKQTVAGVAFSGTLETAYLCCLWSRCANRILLRLANFTVTSQDDLYQGVQKINWIEHLAVDASFAVHFSAKNSSAIINSHFGALKVKDAVVDQMRAKYNKRPAIDTQQPDIRITLYLNGEQAQLSLDLSGASLHKRGYRDSRVPAPIKENLAAAMLLRSQWPALARQQHTLLDPMCGSGTLLLEGAMIAADYAPGLLRDYYGFIGWKQHDTELWRKLRDEAIERRREGLNSMPLIIGFDHHRPAVNAANMQIERAGLLGKIHIERRDISAAKPADSWQAGLLICNPPYGERLGDKQQVAALYQQFGEMLQNHFQGWQATMILSDPELGFRLGIRSQKPVTLYNGALECKLLRMKIEPDAYFIPKTDNRDQRIKQISSHHDQQPSSAGAEMFANRLKKNRKKLHKWVQREHISCYRLYDADLPEYAVAIDIYQGAQTWVNVQEYEAPKTVSREKADLRLAEAMTEIPKVLNIPEAQVFLKIRRKQKKTAQYEKNAHTGAFHIVTEGDCRFLVNFEGYLDTGLFLDHRPIRKMIQQMAAGKSFLNLFAYTGSASVHAAVGGAKRTTTIDLSKTYLEWAEKNFALNKLRGEHEFIQGDCITWLQQQATQCYDLIFLDPPTFSNSKRMEQTFDVQQQHVDLIVNAGKLLSADGMLIFSTNFRRFKMDTAALSRFKLQDISKAMLPEDFSRNPRIHYCWKIQR